MLRRRDFLTGTVAALSAPRVAPAQPPRVGFLFYGSPGPSPELKAFEKGLTDVGYIQAQNIAVDYLFADGRAERLPRARNTARRAQPSVIVAPGTPAAVAAKQATGTIPIVFVGVADAVGS